MLLLDFHIVISSHLSVQIKQSNATEFWTINLQIVKIIYII